MPVTGIGSTAATDSVTALLAGLTAATAALAAYGPSSTTVLKRDAVNFEFTFSSISSTDSTTGLPTAGAIVWPDGTTGAFSGATFDSTAGAYTGYAVTYVGSTTKTVTVSGTAFDTNGNAYGTTAAVT